MVIAGSVNNDFEPFGIINDRPSDGMGPTGRESGRGWPISRGRVGALQVVSERGSVPALTRDGDLWDSDFRDFNVLGLGVFERKKNGTLLSSIIRLIDRDSDFLFFCRR